MYTPYESNTLTQDDANRNYTILQSYLDTASGIEGSLPVASQLANLKIIDIPVQDFSQELQLGNQFTTDSISKTAQAALLIRLAHSMGHPDATTGKKRGLGQLFFRDLPSGEYETYSFEQIRMLRESGQELPQNLRLCRPDTDLSYVLSSNENTGIVRKVVKGAFINDLLIMSMTLHVMQKSKAQEYLTEQIITNGIPQLEEYKTEVQQDILRALNAFGKAHIDNAVACVDFSEIPGRFSAVEEIAQPLLVDACLSEINEDLAFSAYTSTSSALFKFVVGRSLRATRGAAVKGGTKFDLYCSNKFSGTDQEEYAILAGNTGRFRESFQRLRRGVEQRIQRVA
jgi:hypothetical protein